MFDDPKPVIALLFVSVGRRIHLYAKRILVTVLEKLFSDVNVELALMIEVNCG